MCVLCVHVCPPRLLTKIRNLGAYLLATVNRGDFGQIFTIFISIVIMMNSILVFIWGLVSTM